jgi:hypothetical protein
VHTSSGHLIGLWVLGIALALISACGGGGETPPAPQGPKITLFSAAPTDISPGDSIGFTYVVTNADSTILSPPSQKMANPATGTVYVKPVHPTRYVLTAFNGVGRDSSIVMVPMASSVPVIETATLDEDTIIQRDTATLTYSVLRADSVVLTKAGKLASAASGTVRLTPIGTSSYTMTAYNDVGSDTASFSITVEIPYKLTAVNGPYYTGMLDSSRLSPTLAFTCMSQTGQTLLKPWIHFVRVVGDGQVSADSLRPTAQGVANFTYTFSDTNGYALLEAFVRGFDTIRVSARADILTPGYHGQAQYVTFDETCSVLKVFNGLPDAIYPDGGIVYVVFGDAAGLAFAILDDNYDGVAQDGESVFAAIAGFGYRGKTNKGIRIGAHYSDVVAAYGSPQTFEKDTLDVPNLWEIGYPSRGVDFFARLSDTTVIEMLVSKYPLAAAESFKLHHRHNALKN